MKAIRTMVRFGPFRQVSTLFLMCGDLLLRMSAFSLRPKSMLGSSSKMGWVERKCRGLTANAPEN